MNIWRWNGQRIEDCGKGRIRYRIATMYGTKFRIGVRLSEHFAATQDHSGGAFWVMTHLPTGRSMPYASRRTLKASRALAQRMEQAADCSQKLTRGRKFQGVEALKQVLGAA